MRALGAFSGKVDACFPQKMRSSKESSNAAVLTKWRLEFGSDMRLHSDLGNAAMAFRDGMAASQKIHNAEGGNSTW
jgi:hypothetical protein